MLKEQQEIFEILARPSAVPAALLAMSDGDSVSYCDKVGGSVGQGWTNAGELKQLIEITIARQRKGFFTLNEAAQILADMKGADVERLKQKMLRDFEAGLLTIRDPVDDYKLACTDRARDFYNLVTINDVDEWLESQGVGHRFPNSETEQQDLQVTITSNHIQFAHGTAFVPYSYLAELLAEAQCYGEVDDTNMMEFLDRQTHREALLKAVEHSLLPIKNRFTKTPFDLMFGSAQLSKNKIESSACVTVGDFQTYANALGVRVIVAELNHGLQKIDIATDSSKGTVSPIQPASEWKLKTTIQRYSGYRLPLHNFLKQQLAQGKPCPKARDVIDEWSRNFPIDIQVMSDSIKFNNAKGELKEANLKAIQQSIKNLLDE